MAIKDYSTTPDLNTQISGINIAEGCAPSGINNAIRQLMADVKAEKEAKDAAQAAKDAAQDTAIAEAKSIASNELAAALSAQASKDAAQDEDIATKLAKSGGRMTGGIIVVADPNIISFATTNGYINFNGGDAYNGGATLTLYGKDYSASPGYAVLRAKDASNQTLLRLSPAGIAYLNGIPLLHENSPVSPANISVPTTYQNNGVKTWKLPAGGTWRVFWADTDTQTVYFYHGDYPGGAELGGGKNIGGFAVRIA